MLQEAERESPEDVEVLLYLAELYRNGDKRPTPRFRSTSAP